MGKKLDLKGRRFHNLLVLEEVPERVKGLVAWKCQCDCGNIAIIPGAYLHSGNTKSCGCKKNIGLVNYNNKNSEESKISIGEKFGYLEVVEDLGLKPYYNTKHNRRYYRCLCTKCGKYKDYSQNELKSNKRFSCGCIGSKGEEKIKKILEENNIKYVFDHGFPGIQEETGYKLRFDFILYKEGKVLRCIEFDGRQHTEGIKGGSWSHAETLSTIQERDLKKNEYCKNHKIPLVRIPYTYLNKITIDTLLGDNFLV